MAAIGNEPHQRNENDPTCVCVVKLDADEMAADLETKEGRAFFTHSILGKIRYPDSTVIVMYVVGEGPSSHEPDHCLVVLFDNIEGLVEDLSSEEHRGYYSQGCRDDAVSQVRAILQRSPRAWLLLNLSEHMITTGMLFRLLPR